MKVEKEDSLIGEKYGNEEQLTVVDWVKDSTGIKKYRLFCSICSQDKELFGDGYFFSRKGDLKRGRLPCGCSKSTKFSTAQWKIVVKRIAEKKDYEVVGFLDEKLTSKTYINLKCKKHDYGWNTCNIDKFIQGSGCPLCGDDKCRIAQTKEDEIITKAFYDTGSYTNVSWFRRSKKLTSQGRPSNWEYACNICSNDEYVKNGLCSGVFTANLSNLRDGKLSCRCNASYRWTEAQREFQINKTLDPIYKFVGWETKYVNNKSRLTCHCPEHGDWTTCTSYVIDMQRGCPDCSIAGYKRYNPAVFYVLEITGRICDFVGYGITTSLETRMQKHKSNLSKQGFRIVNSTFIELSGENALTLEREVKKKFDRYAQSVEGFKTESTYQRNLNDLIDFAEEFSDNLEL